MGILPPLIDPWSIKMTPTLIAVYFGQFCKGTPYENLKFSKKKVPQS